MNNGNPLYHFDNPDSIYLFISKLQRTNAWISLKDKTQVFNVRRSGEVKTRGSHCEDVGRIAADLVRCLTDDPTEIEKARLVGFIHDLGHIPYGHAGEAVADSIISSHEFNEEEKKNIGIIRELLFGKEYNDGTKKKDENGELVDPICFEHNENSVLQYIMLCKQFGYEVDQDIVLGILAHSTSRYGKTPPTLAQQAVRLADKLAYINYDVNDLFISFEDKPELKQALIEMYSKPLTIVNPKTGVKEPVKIVINGKEITMLEFAKMDAEEKISLFVSESVRDAKNTGKITGCNELIVEISRKAKEKKKLGKKLKDKNLPEEERTKIEENITWLQKEIDELYFQVYERSPILYAAYIMKERSDNFIRTYEGLSLESKREKTLNAESAVGNKDLEKEFIYKQLASVIEENIDLDKLEANDKYSPTEKAVIRELVTKFLKYKENEDNVIKSLEGNTNGVTYPVIYSIVNFIGTFKNAELDKLAEKLNITARFREEVLPLLAELVNNKDYYDPKTGLLTGDGLKKREEIVLKYGAIINLHYGMEEESLAPSTADEIIELLAQCGYAVEDTEFYRRMGRKAIDLASQNLVKYDDVKYDDFVSLETEDDKLINFRNLAEIKEKEFINNTKGMFDPYKESGRNL